MADAHMTLSEHVPDALPPPLAKITKRPLRWLRNKAVLLVYAGFGATAGMLAMVSAYYLLTQVIQPVNDAWHTLIPHDDMRHHIRDVGEGFLGGLLAVTLTWNHYKKKLSKPRTKLDELEIKLHIPNPKDDRPLSVWQLLASPFLAMLYAAPGFFVAMGIVYLARHFHDQLMWLADLLLPSWEMPGGTIGSKLTSIWTKDLDQKFMGYGAAFFFGRRPVRGVIDDLQLWFAERRVLRNQPPPRWHPPTSQARYNDVLARRDQINSRHFGDRFSVFAKASLYAFVVLVLMGEGILVFIAP